MLELDSIQIVLLLLAVGGVACLYSSVGHGGATGYLAAAAFLGIFSTQVRPSALWMNCVVAGIAFGRFYRAGFFNCRIFLSLAATSIPCAWLGSRVPLDGHGYALVLGAALLLAGALLGWGRSKESTALVQTHDLPIALSVGGVLGFLAGLTGIGGGVFLTPLLIFLNWTPAKVAGGISALFIVVNSIAGLLGLGARAMVWQPAFYMAVAVGIAGAMLGTHYGVKRWRNTGFQRALAIVLWIAAGKLILTGQ